jgi:hypothetical protein
MGLEEPGPLFVLVRDDRSRTKQKHFLTLDLKVQQYVAKSRTVVVSWKLVTWFFMRLGTAAIRQRGLLCAQVTDVRRCVQKFKKCEGGWGWICGYPQCIFLKLIQQQYCSSVLLAFSIISPTMNELLIAFKMFYPSGRLCMHWILVVCVTGKMVES